MTFKVRYNVTMYINKTYHTYVNRNLLLNFKDTSHSFSLAQSNYKFNFDNTIVEFVKTSAITK